MLIRNLNPDILFFPPHLDPPYVRLSALTSNRHAHASCLHLHLHSKKFPPPVLYSHPHLAKFKATRAPRSFFLPSRSLHRPATLTRRFCVNSVILIYGAPARTYLSQRASNYEITSDLLCRRIIVLSSQHCVPSPQSFCFCAQTEPQSLVRRFIFLARVKTVREQRGVHLQLEGTARRVCCSLYGLASAGWCCSLFFFHAPW